jgi:hypothetical protein
MNNAGRNQGAKERQQSAWQRTLVVVRRLGYGWIRLDQARWIRLDGVHLLHCIIICMGACCK